LTRSSRALNAIHLITPILACKTQIAKDGGLFFALSSEQPGRIGSIIRVRDSSSAECALRATR
jgi:hypothetical protein